LPSLFCRAVFGLPMAITAIQILAIDLVTEMLPLTALTRDPPEPWLMSEWPRNVSNHIINKSVIIDLLRSGFLMWWIAFGNYVLYLVLNGHGLNSIQTNVFYYPIATSITYASIVFSQFANIISRRAGTHSAFTSYLWSNKTLLYAFAISICFLSILIYVPVVSSYFGFGGMRAIDRLFPIIGWFIFLMIREAYKYFKRRNKITSPQPLSIP
jgi:Ca2+-transporting ATPase